MNPDDAWRAETDRKVAQAMAQKARDFNVRRSIDSLTMAEMTLLARVAVDTWIVELSHRGELQQPYEDPEIGLA